MSAQVYLGVYRDGRSVAFDNMAKRAISGTTDWTQCSVVLDVVSDATLIKFGFFVKGTGTAWLNNPQFEIVGTDIPTTDDRARSSSPVSPASKR